MNLRHFIYRERHITEWIIFLGIRGLRLTKSTSHIAHNGIWQDKIISHNSYVKWEWLCPSFIHEETKHSLMNMYSVRETQRETDRQKVCFDFVKGDNYIVPKTVWLSSLVLAYQTKQYVSNSSFLVRLHL